MNMKKIIVAVSLDESTQRPLEYLKAMPIPLDAEILLVNMVTETLIPSDSDFAVYKYPGEGERPKIEEEISKILRKIKNEIFPGHQNVSTKILFDTNIKAAFTDFVEKQRPDLVVVATRGRHGIKNFFDSSFAQHQVKYSPANVLILRQGHP